MKEKVDLKEMVKFMNESQSIKETSKKFGVCEKYVRDCKMFWNGFHPEDKVKTVHPDGYNRKDRTTLGECPPKWQEAVKLKNNGLGTSAIARKLNMTYQNVVNILKKTKDLKDE